MDDLKAVGDGPWSATLMVSGETRQVAIEMLRALLAAIDIATDTQTINLTNTAAEGRYHLNYIFEGLMRYILLTAAVSGYHTWMSLCCKSMFTTLKSRLPTCCPTCNLSAQVDGMSKMPPRE